MERRDFLKVAAITAGALSLPRPTHAQEPPSTAPVGSPSPTGDALGLAGADDVVRGEMRYRKLGRTGVEVSLIGLGGHHIGRPKDPQVGIDLIREAVDRGITFLDNCWDYHDGESERRMGKALKDGYRDKVFLMTKIDGRTKDSARKQLDECLQRLQTDHIDLVQHHEVLRMEDGDRIHAPGAAHEALLEAQKAGKVRFVGFTGHKDPLVHLRMLEVAAQHGIRYDAVQMPLNVMDAHFRSFAARVVPELVKQGIAVLGMKSMADGAILKSKTVTPIECLHYAMGLPTSVVITGMESQPILDQAFEAVKTFRPPTPADRAALLAKTAQAAARGEFERFKTSSQFDGTAQHPDWLGPPEQGPG